MRRLVLWSTAVPWVLLGCGVFEADVLPLGISIHVDESTKAVGEDFEFEWEGTGERLFGVIIDYGDGVVDSIQSIGGGIRLGGNAVHAFNVAGNFRVVARVEDEFLGADTSSVSVIVTGN
jgi:hypothetical protein